MPNSPMTSVIAHIRRAGLLRDGAELGDGELLRGFIERHDQAAFTALVQRHGPMVWAVCRRLLSHHDAEDAFQAAFLVLVRKAATVVPREMVGNWLYGVAHQTALMARRTATRRRAREVQMTVMPDTEAVQHDPWPDVQPVLDQELSRLPDIYRAVVVLCDLEGRTRNEVARQLGVPEGTVGGRLARARAMLAKRLARRGVALSGGVLAAVLARDVASASVPNAVVSSTIKAARLLAAGEAAAGGAISVKVAALTEGVMKAMLFTKLRAALAVVLILVVVATGAITLTYRTAAGQDDTKPAAEKPVAPAAQPEKEKEAFTVWGKEVGGLQAGLGFRLGEKRAYSHGETATLVVRVRNVGKENVKFQYLKGFFMEKPPNVTGGEGKAIRFGGVDLFAVDIPVHVNLAPGKEMELHDLKLKLGPASEGGDVTEVSPETLHGKGKFQIQYKQLAAASIDPNLTKLATGKLELEVKEAEKQEKEGFTAWGKEVGGLQAGLGDPPGQRRTYYTGETAKLVVRVRNVSKVAVKFQYYPLFLTQTPPTVTDDGGKRVQFRYGIMDTAVWHEPVEVDLAPRKEIVLGEVELPTILGTGKFTVQYERVFGKTYQGRHELDPALSKLATGKLELEIKPDPPRVSDKSITIRVVIEKVNAPSRAITASSVASGVIDGERKPLRLEDLAVSIYAKVRIKGKESALADLKPGTGARLELDGRESTLTVIGIEVPDDHPPAGAPEGAPDKK